MNKQGPKGIGWCTHTWNPIKGKCPVACDYCYARRIYDRFGYDPTIRFDEKELMAPYKLKKPAKIFVGSTMELFGDLIHPWMEDILKVVRSNRRHTFQFLTKVPKVMRDFEFTDNCWCGTSIGNDNAMYRLDLLRGVSASIKFVSFEPLHSNFIPTCRFESLSHLDWIIIGAETGNRKGKIIPKKQWIEQIIEVADAGNVAVFMKDNLKPYWHGELRQEFPK